MRPLTLREQRLAAVGLLVLAIALVWFAIVQPLVGGFFDRAAERTQLADTLKRNVRLEASLPAWRAAASQQRASAGRFAITAPSEEIAVETFKERLIHLAGDEGFAVGGVEDLQANAAPGTVRIRADMTLTLSQFTDTMKRLETEGAYLVVDYLSISADRAAAAGRLSPMDVRLELSAAWRPSGPERPELTAMAACGALVLALGLQFILPYREATPEVDGLAIRHPRPIVVPLLPESPAILRIPLFAPDRRPGEAGSASAGGGSLGGYAALGAASGHGVGTSVISGPGNAVKTLRVGDEVEGWRLAIVSATKLTFERKGAIHVLVVGEPAEVVSKAADPASNPAEPQ